MKISCDTIRDILPLYYDNACSEETRKLVEDHLSECSDCQKIFEDMASDLNIESEVNEDKAQKNFLKSVKKKILRKNVIIAVIAIILGAGTSIGGYFYLHDHETPIWWGEGLASVSLEDNNHLYLNFEDKDYYGTYVHPIRITENGEDKNIVLVYYTSTFWTENISKGMGKGNRAFELGTAKTHTDKEISDDTHTDISEVYYYVTDMHMATNSKNIEYVQSSIKETTNNYTTPPEGAILLWEQTKL